jgi:hypothetical protein
MVIVLTISKCFVFLVYAGSGSGQSVLIWADPEHRESKEKKATGGELQCGGLRPLCDGWLGGSSVEEGVGQPDGVP